MSDTTAEMELLRAAVRSALGDGKTEDLLAASLEGIDWHRLLWLGRQHNALLFLHHALGSPQLAGVAPPEVQSQLRNLSEARQLRSLLRVREVCQLQDLFDRDGISPILTGRWMAVRCTDLPPNLIESGLDLHAMVPEKDLDRGLALVRAAGHPVEANPEKLIKRGFSPVQLNLGLGRHPAARRFWEQASTLQLGGRAFRRLAPAHWLIVRTPNEAVSSRLRLARAAEVVGLARQIAAGGWSHVLEEAALFGVAPTVAAGVSACHRALGLPVPRELDELTGSAPAADEPAIASEITADASLTAPFLPTPPPVVRRMLELAAVGPEDLVCDLGCGDGRIAIQAARRFGARGFGIDRDPARIAEATARAAAQGVSDRVSFACGDLFTADLGRATVVIFYLLPQHLEAVRDKLQREARPGTRVISHDYPFPGWPSEKTEIIRTGPLNVSQIYLWRIA